MTHTHFHLLDFGSLLTLTEQGVADFPTIRTFDGTSFATVWNPTTSQR